ncbi:MTH865 family protein [Halorutilales archaeon Cl-col2-1]
MDTDTEDLRDRIYEVVEDASYPVEKPMDLVPHLPDGLSTTVEVDGESFSAVEIGKAISDDFPFENADDLADTVAEALGD